MSQTHHKNESRIDWEAVFKQMTGSQESAIAHDDIARYLANSRDMSRSDGASVVRNAAESGRLTEIVVEKFPDLHRRFYFVPPMGLENPGTVFVPFWNYVCTEVIPNRGGFCPTELCDRIAERAEGDVPEWVLRAMDKHLEEIAPVTTGFQSMTGRTLQADTAEVYETLAESHGTTERHPDRFS